jgi:4a-hydroxytetrahydrobiopterin dehydratase
MRKLEKLSDAQLATIVAGLADWNIVNGRLHREYLFPDFAHAIGFMTIAAPAIEKMKHHPEWSNVYNRVSVDLVTHDAGGITAQDVRLAMALEAIACKLK